MRETEKPFLPINQINEYLILLKNLSFNLSRRIFSRHALDLGPVHASSLPLQNLNAKDFHYPQEQCNNALRQEKSGS